MAEVLRSPTIVAARGSSNRLRAAATPAPLKRSQFWGFSTDLAARQQLQQFQHRYALLQSRRTPLNRQVLNTAPWLRWWEKDGAPNMVDINSMQQFVDELSNAGDRLVIVEFYSRGCSGCRSLYPKLCKIAREHPEIIFLKINFDDNTEICKALNVRMLPLFFVYRAQGHLESFSCTISKIQRLRDAIAKYSGAGSSSSKSPTPAKIGSIGSLLEGAKAATAAATTVTAGSASSNLKDAVPA